LPVNLLNSKRALSASHSAEAKSSMLEMRAAAADMSVYAGTYTNPGYGTLVLCSAANPSSACKPVLAGFAALTPNNALPTGQMFGYFTRVKVWASQVRLVGTASPAVFAFTGTTLFPAGYGANTSAFEMVGTAPGSSVEFVLGKGGKVQGFGLFAVDGKPFAFEAGPGSVQQRAEVWFDKTA
jgi:hypothetical protein